MVLVLRISPWLEPLPGPRKLGTRGTHSHTPHEPTFILFAPTFFLFALLGAVEEDAGGFFFSAYCVIGAYGAVVELVVV